MSDPPAKTRDANVCRSVCHVTPLFAAFRHAKVRPAIRSTNGSPVSRRWSAPSFLSSAPVVIIVGGVADLCVGIGVNAPGCARGATLAPAIDKL